LRFFWANCINWSAVSVVIFPGVWFSLSLYTKQYLHLRSHSEVSQTVISEILELKKGDGVELDTRYRPLSGRLREQIQFN
jgi:hypothetical protein